MTAIHRKIDESKFKIGHKYPSFSPNLNENCKFFLNRCILSLKLVTNTHFLIQIWREIESFVDSFL